MAERIKSWPKGSNHGRKDEIIVDRIQKSSSTGSNINRSIHRFLPGVYSIDEDDRIIPSSLAEDFLKRTSTPKFCLASLAQFQARSKRRWRRCNIIISWDGISYILLLGCELA